MKRYFKNATNIFEATINETMYQISIKIGGKTYNDCINISIHKGKPAEAKISHLQMEPECSFNTILEETESSNFIKASLQYVSYIYPNITRFMFDDMSNIDCIKKRTNVMPRNRRQTRPFSLAHLYLATHGETWYEKIFGAKMINTELYTIYTKAKHNLYQKIDIEYTHFKQLYSITTNNDVILSQYYSMDKTWLSFFTSIPREQRCTGLYNWLPTFINDKINHTFITNGWYIDIHTMPKTVMEIIDTPLQGGYVERNIKKRTRKTQKTLQFLNKQFTDRNGYIFDGDIF